MWSLVTKLYGEVNRIAKSERKRKNVKMEFSKKWLIDYIIILIVYTTFLYILTWFDKNVAETLIAEISGITSDLSPFIDLIISDDIVASDKEMTQWSYITKATISDNIITFRRDKTKPNIELNFKVKVV